nr:MAG: putative RNA-dependent RNA polymerase [Narnaviridae sp.]
MMNLYKLITSIDGVLDRLTAVLPLWKDRHGGSTQWLFLHETQDSFESELSRAATVLSAPSFPNPRDPSLGEEDVFPLSSLGTPLPKPSVTQTAYSVDFRLLQVLSGVRSVLLVLIDSAAITCRKPSGEADPDFIGALPVSNAMSAIVIMATWKESDFVANAKYWKDWPLARFLENPLPPCPPSWGLSPEDPLFSGDLRRFVTRASRFPWQHQQSPAFYRLVFGLAQSKRGFATVPRSFVKAALVKHRNKLSVPPPGTPDLADLQRFVKVLLRGFRAPSILDSLVQQEASTRASNDVSRLEGGGREDLRQQLIAAFGSPDGLVRMVDLGPNGVVEEKGFLPPSKREWAELLSQPIDDWSHLPERKLKKVPAEFRAYPRAKVAEVLEPLKVRLITAMHALRTFVAKPLQQALWRHLRNFPPFQLIGEEISTGVIRDLLDRHKALFGLEDEDDLDFVSGDYSAATDGLDIRASKLILEEILTHLNPDEASLAPFMRAILYEQVLEYPAWAELAPVLQKNGQLMGSILSFPILCIANLFTYVASLPDKQRELVLQGRLSIHRLPVIVNGDDILFRASDAFYTRWLQSIQTVGFVPSVGKNFRHKRFFTVNSVPIEYVPDLVRDDFFWFLRLKEKISWADLEELPEPRPHVRLDSVDIHGFLNVGLLTGQAKLTGRDTLGALPLSGWHAGSVLPAANPPLAHRWFLKYHRSAIVDQTSFGPSRDRTTLNIFAHPLLGGLGFRVPPGVVPVFTEKQRALAHALFLAASVIYEGQAKDYPLASLLYLDATEKSSGTILGHRRDRVEIQMYPIGAPLPDGYSPFEDHSALHVTPLARPIDVGTAPMQASCRLSNSQLHRLLKGARRHEQTLHPIESMTSFPFLPVRVERDRVLAGSVVPIVSVYHPASFFTDISVPSAPSSETLPLEVLAPGDDTTILVIPRVEAAPELWELPTVSSALQREILGGVRLRNVAALQARDARRAIVRQRIQASTRFRHEFLRPVTAQMAEDS